VSNEAVYGAEESVEIAFQVFAPAGEYWKVTVLTEPGAVSLALAVSATVRRRSAAAAGAVIVPAGRVRSIVTTDVCDVERPAASVAVALTTRSPSVGTGQETEYGEVVSTPSETQPAEQVEPAARHCSKSTEATPVPASVAVALSVSGSALDVLTTAGALSVRVGAVLSTVTVRTGEVKELPATSRVIARRS